MRVVYSPEFVSCLDGVYRYICQELSSPIAASNAVERILDDCSVLSAFPESGRKVFRTDGAEADFRILQSRGKMIVYDVADDVVRVVTLIDSRTDELSELVR